MWVEQKVWPNWKVKRIVPHEISEVHKPTSRRPLEHNQNQNLVLSLPDLLENPGKSTGGRKVYAFSPSKGTLKALTANAYGNLECVGRGCAGGDGLPVRRSATVMLSVDIANWEYWRMDCQ